MQDWLAELDIELLFMTKRIKRVLAVGSTVEWLIERGGYFGTFTFCSSSESGLDVEPWTEWRQDWGKFLRKLRKETGVCGVRVFQCGKRRGRFHVHTINDREIGKVVIEHCKIGGRLGFHEMSGRIEGRDLVKYMVREFVKPSVRVEGVRSFATFGEFAGRYGAEDFLIWSACAECMKLGLGLRGEGDSFSEAIEEGRQIFWAYLQGAESLESLGIDGPDWGLDGFADEGRGEAAPF